jgi:hypothetical protein
MGLISDIKEIKKGMQRLRIIETPNALIDRTTAGTRIKPKAQATIAGTPATTDTIPRWG